MNLKINAAKAHFKSWLFLGTTLLASAAVLSLAGCATTAGSNGSKAAKVPSEQKLAMNAADVLRNQMQQPANKRIPDDLINSARCIAVFPSVVKAGFIVGGTRGHGLISCRKQGANGWSQTAPAYYTLTSGSIGLQAGVKSSQLILLFLNQNSVDNLLKDNIKFGTDLSIAAGPVGYNANIHTAPAPVVSYQVSSTGLFAGLNLSGSSLSFDKNSNEQVYKKVESDPRDVLFDTNHAPSSVQDYNHALDAFAPSSHQQQLNGTNSSSQ